MRSADRERYEVALDRLSRLACALRRAGLTAELAPERCPFTGLAVRLPPQVTVRIDASDPGDVIKVPVGAVMVFVGGARTGVGGRMGDLQLIGPLEKRAVAAEKIFDQSAYRLVDRKHAMFPHHDNDDDRLLTPREVAGLFGVRTTTIARWSRDGRLFSFTTPGGHRRYRMCDVRALMEEEQGGTDLDRQTAEDAVRLYDQGWSIRQVAEKFDLEYTTMRRLLKHNGVRFRRQGNR